MRLRELIFGAIAAALLVGYAVVGGRVAPFVSPGAAASPAPARPVSAVPAPMVRGTIAFILRGDVFVLRNGQYTDRTTEGRSVQPSLSADGGTLYFSRVEQIDGLRAVDGAVVNAQLGFSDIVRKPAGGGTEETLVKGLTAPAPNRFHVVKWFLAPAVSPDGKRLAAIEGDDDGTADLVVFDLATKRPLVLSNGGDWADPAWSPDGTTIVVTSYDRGVPQLLLKPADNRGAAVPVKGIPTGEPYGASYSPDGKWLVYSLRHDDGRKNDVHAIEVQTGRDVALTSDGTSWNGVISPDGRQLAFLHAEGFTIDLWVVDLAEALAGGRIGQAFKITRGEGVDGTSRPAWGR
ncbi:MAG TPA: LpqB family beta-propeller domain-containing protein [Candidatus Limnocylindria bacterium]|jgi:TolB protein